MNPFKLTKEEFIIRSVAGEKFINSFGNTLHYDQYKSEPFRCDDSPLLGLWLSFDTEQFTLVKTEPKVERRYKWLRDNVKGYTFESSYISDRYAKSQGYAGEDGWYKSELFIDIVLKQ